MTTGIILTVLGIVGYISNVLLIRRYINRRMPRDFDAHEKFANGNYAWESTAGIGVVPKWVSLIGILGVTLFAFGVFIIIFSLL